MEGGEPGGAGRPARRTSSNSEHEEGKMMSSPPPINSALASEEEPGTVIDEDGAVASGGSCGLRAEDKDELGSSAESTGRKLDSAAAHVNAAAAVPNSEDSGRESGGEEQGQRDSPPRAIPPPVESDVGGDGSARRLAGALGMAVATVVHEVLEQRGGGPSAGTLSYLLEVALRETMAGVAGDEQACFVGDFRSSFSSAYSTIRSVRRAFVKVGGGHRARQHRSKTWREAGGARHYEESRRKGSEKRRRWAGRGARTEDVEGVAPYFSAESARSVFFSGGDDSEREDKSFFSCSNLERVGSEDSLSPSNDVFSAANSGEWVMVSGSSSQTTTASRASGPHVSFDAWAAESESRSSVTESRASTGVSAGPSTSIAGTEASRASSSADPRSASSPRPSVNFLEANRPATEPFENHLHIPHIGKSFDTNVIGKSVYTNVERESDDGKGKNTHLRESRSSSHADPRIEFGERESPVSTIAEDGNGEKMLVRRRPAGQVWVESAGDDESAVLDPPSFSGYGIFGGREALIRRFVEAQEAQNRLLTMKLAHGVRRLSAKEEHMRLHVQSNELTRETIGLGRSKAEFREFELEDRKLAAAHQELSRTCADELVTGLLVMLVALGYSAWKFSYARLSRMVAVCQLPPEKEPRRMGWMGPTNWVAAGMDALSWRMRALTCEVMKAGRMTFGLVLIAFITSWLFRRSVTSSSQTMPATIILVVLAGVCGFAGKVSIDSLGGNGFVWVVLWEVLCAVHALATCFTPLLYKYLHGPSSKAYKAGKSFWLKACSLWARLFFHSFLAFFLPVMAGLLPFASFGELREAFWELWEAEASFPEAF